MRRRFRMVLLLLAMAGMTWYGKADNPAVTLQDCLNDPARYDGRRIILATEVTVVRIWPDSLWVRQMGRLCTVLGPPGTAQPGDYLSLVGIFRAPARLDLEQLHPAKGRRAKILWSALPPLILAGFWLAAYRFRFSTLCWEERKSCQTW
ncbi:MAG TPA: hypothetical protein PLG50_01430 [bacterium]|nr:hypothetical protein [bacterium]HQG44305.1 hypothetical protein [bacterium]HQI49950.1 hypothetical protein [bacterium]HQJ63642.1 hypothetical protein [bacterium]